MTSMYIFFKQKLYLNHVNKTSPPTNHERKKHVDAATLEITWQNAMKFKFNWLCLDFCEESSWIRSSLSKRGSY